MTEQPKADLQIDSSDVGKPLGVSIRDARGEGLGEAYATPESYQAQAAKLSFEAPASWKITTGLR